MAPTNIHASERYFILPDLKYSNLKEAHLEGRDAVVPLGFGFPLSVLLHQCSIIIFVIIIIYQKDKRAKPGNL